ncbi:MAG TPA: nuclear transport factor 2 family protein [Mucilaginibacter sp.]|nr:nuclear transport factor 2 family protein [Mucilaginibacter sp.]
MFKNISILLFVCLCNSCVRQDKTQSARNLIIEHFKLLNEHNLKDLAKEYSKNVFVVSPDCRSLGGAEPIIRYYQLAFTYCKNTRFNVHEIIANDSVVVVKYDIMGEKLTRPPTQTNFYPSGISVRECTVFKIKNNKIVDEDTYTNDSYYQG